LQGDWTSVVGNPGALYLVKDWKKGSDYRFPEAPEGKHFRVTWMVKPDGQVALVQQCVDTRWERADRIGKELWHKDVSGLVHALERLDVLAELDRVWKHRQLGRGSGESSGVSPPAPSAPSLALLKVLLAPMGQVSLWSTSAEPPGDDYHLTWKEGVWQYTKVAKGADLTLRVSRTTETSRRMVTVASDKWIFDEATLGLGPPASAKSAAKLYSQAGGENTGFVGPPDDEWAALEDAVRRHPMKGTRRRTNLAPDAERDRTGQYLKDSTPSETVHEGPVVEAAQALLPHETIVEVQVNRFEHGGQCQRHRDAKNQQLSRVALMGDFVGGALVTDRWGKV